MKRIVIVLALLAACAVLFAKDVGGVNLPDSMNAGGSNLVLNGAGTRVKVIIKVYAGGLYLKAKTNKADTVIQADEPMALRLHFVRDVDNKSIVDAWNEGFKNSAGSSLASLSQKIAQFNGCFSDAVEKDNVYEIIYVPGSGTSVSINGNLKATIPGLDFKQAVFGIWLCNKPADVNLKKALLGG